MNQLSGRIRRAAVTLAFAVSVLLVPATGALGAETADLAGGVSVEKGVDRPELKVTSHADSFEKADAIHGRFDAWHYYKAKKRHHRQAMLNRTS